MTFLSRYDGLMYFRLNALGLDREKAIAAIERGHDAAQLAAFLQERDNQPLPVQVEGFLRNCSKQGTARR